MEGHNNCLVFASMWQAEMEAINKKTGDWKRNYTVRVMPELPDVSFARSLRPQSEGRGCKQLEEASS